MALIVSKHILKEILSKHHIYITTHTIFHLLGIYIPYVTLRRGNDMHTKTKCVGHIKEWPITRTRAVQI